MEGFDIDGVFVPTDGFADCSNLWVLWQGPKRRGKNRIIPKKPGEKSKPRRATGTLRSLELVFYGENDATGAPLGLTVREGLEANLDFFRLNVADPTNLGDGTRTLTLYLPSGATKSGPITVEDFDFAGLGPTSVRATLDLTIPEGALS